MHLHLRTRLLVWLAIGLFPVCLTVVSHARKTAGPTVPQTPLPDKPIEQTRKNIQVLKGLHESELYRVMNFMAVSIGEECDFCHVVKGRDPKTGQRNWEWESDEA